MALDRLRLAKDLPAVLFSIDGEWADAIIVLDKPFEYRKTIPNLDPPYIILLYATAPRKAVVGEAIVDDVREGPVDVVVRTTVEAGPHDAEDLYEYFDGYDHGYALHIDEARRFDTPIPLEQLREVGIEPTPNFRHVDAEAIER